MKNSNCDFVDDMGSVITNFPETQKYYNKIDLIKLVRNLSCFQSHLTFLKHNLRNYAIEKRLDVERQKPFFAQYESRRISLFNEDKTESHLNVECVDVELPDNITLVNDDDIVNRHYDKGFKIENKWEGIIEEISDGIVYARMYDFETDSEDFAEFKIDDFDNVFIEENAEEGDRFFFYIGYSESPYRKNIGIISIRKYYLEKPSEKKINEILDKINRLKENFV